MLTDDQLAARIGPRLRAELADLPVPDLSAALRHRQARQARRARIAVALTTVPVAAAAFAAAAFLPGSTTQKITPSTTQNTAYVVSHVTQALSAVPAGTISFTRETTISGTEVTYTGDNGRRTWEEWFTPAGRLESETGTLLKGRALTVIGINYRDKTWSRASFTAWMGGIASLTCSDWALFAPDGATAAWLRTAVSCGDLKVDGTATVDGVTAVKLIGTIGRQKEALTYYVSPATYLPVRMTLGNSVQADFRWLPPTPANLAKLALPTPPAGFTQAHDKPVSVRPSPTPTVP